MQYFEQDQAAVVLPSEVIVNCVDPEKGFVFDPNSGPEWVAAACYLHKVRVCPGVLAVSTEQDNVSQDDKWCCTLACWKGNAPDTNLAFRLYQP